MKISELTGPTLDWAVAKCEGVQWATWNLNGWSNDWALGGPIIEREKIGVWWATHFVDDEGVEYGNHWYAEYGVTDESADKTYQCQTGTTPLIAAMRCYVASKLGNEIEIPEELK